MQGIQLVLQANNIKPDNIGQAVQAINKLPIDLPMANNFLNLVFEYDANDIIPIVNNLTEARTLLALVVQAGLRKNVEKFSIGSFKTFYNHAKAIRREDVPNPQPITIYKKKPELSTPVSVLSLEPATVVPSVVEPATVVPQPEIVVPTVVEPVPDVEPVTIEPVESVPAIKVQTAVVKGKRNRKVDPTSNLSRAKALYASAIDKSRNSFVALLQAELGIELGTATTYYYIAKKG